VLTGLGDGLDAVMDSGACPVGLESTVLDLTGPHPILLRPGGMTVEAIERTIGPVMRPTATPTHVIAPGMLASHYAPRRPVRLGAASVAADEGLLAFGSPMPGAGLVFNLSESGDLIEAAARLYAGLHWLDDAEGICSIAVMDIPATGLGLAIRDRLTRAAAPRP
jgi:L-threonylcarbamoyladenylate synthase